MPVRKGLDSSLFDYRFVFFDAATRDDYFAVFLLAWLRSLLRSSLPIL
jgi:hypothetical protein